MSDPRFEPVMSLADIPQGSMRAATVAGREIVICHTRDGVFALDNICTHAHARMCEGRLRATRIVCPLHGASFDIRDGKVLGPPATAPLPTFPLRIVEGTIEVAVGPAR
jgi:3-phenylpropionate/trans-cinnamate dioxygenase ferredoxin subunit